MSIAKTVTIAPSLSDRVETAIALAPERVRETFALFDIVETREVETAAIRGDSQPILEINPDWVAEHAPTREKLLMLLLHESLHVLLGHTRLFSLTTLLDNIVLDAVINAMLCSLYPVESCTAFFTDFYDDHAYPECFLRPASIWTPGGQKGVPAALQSKERREAAQVHKGLYSERSVPTADLYRVIRPIGHRTLIGNHGTGDEWRPGPSPLVREIVAKIGRDLTERGGVAGTGFGGLLEQVSVKPAAAAHADRDALIRILRKLGRRLISSPLPLRRQGTDVVSVHTALPSPDRRTTVLRAMGITPLFYAGETVSPSRTPLTERVHVYLDVSASVADLRRPLYGAVLAARALVFPVVHLFSTNVADVSLAELRSGVCRTTGGTSLDDVATHIEEHRVRRALIITDGHVGRLSDDVIRVLSGIRLGVALVLDRNPSQQLIDLASVQTTLCGEGGKESSRATAPERRRTHDA